MKTETLSPRTLARLPRWIVTTSLLSASLALTAQQPGYGYPQQGYDQQAYQGDQQSDPPSRVGRLSILQGNVSFQSQGAQDFSAAEINYPLTNGDRLYTDTGALTELQAGQLAVRLGQQTDLTVTALDDQTAVFGLAQGSVHLRAYALDPNTNTELDTPNASIVVTQPGDFRIDVSPQGDSTIISVLSGQLQVSAEGVNQYLEAGQSLGIAGIGQSVARRVGRPRTDVLDSFSADRDRNYQSYFASTNGYVNSDTIGAADLGAYGDWGQDNDYGAVWYPRGVAADWAPYTNGHWVSVAPWGWTWVGYEPWGFAPFHYGRWNRFGNRWGWVPGPQVVRPVYSPALVAFVGGGGFSLSIGGGGGGVAAWFPLGPREVYRPWYRSSPVYVNRVNVTNIYSRNQVDVRRIYNSRTNIYNNVTVNNYVNRGYGTVAISARDFGSRRAVRDVQIRGAATRQFANAPVMDRPPVAAPSRPMAGAPVRAIPPRGTQRPVFDTRNDARNGQGYGNQRPNGSFRTRDTDSNHSGPDGYMTNRPNPGQPGAGGNNQPNRGNNGQSTDGQAAPVVRPGQGTDSRYGNFNDNRFNRGNDGRTNNPVPTTTVTPTQPAAPVQQPNRDNGNRDNRYNNGGYNNDNRYNRGNDGRTNNPAPTTTVTPAAPTQVQPTAPAQQPSRDNRLNNDGTNDNRFNRGNGGRGNNPAPTSTMTPVTQAPIQPAAPAQQPTRDNNNGNRDNRFNNGGDRGNRQQAPSPTVTTPAPVQQPAPVVTPQVPRPRPNPDVNMNPRFERPQTQVQPQQQAQPQQQQRQEQRPIMQQVRPQTRVEPAARPEEKKN